MTKKQQERIFGNEFIENFLALGGIVDEVFKFAPRWEREIVRRVEKSITKAVGFNERKVRSPEMIGKFSGQLAAMAKAKFPKRPDEKMASPKLKKVIRGFRAFFKDTVGPACKWFDEKLLIYASELPVKDQSAFCSGRAIALERNVAGLGFWEGDNTRLYLALLFLDPLMPRIQSVRELHDALCKVMKPSLVGDQKRIEKLCQRIGLKFREAGRPKRATASSACRRMSAFSASS